MPIINKYNLQKAIVVVLVIVSGIALFGYRSNFAESPLTAARKKWIASAPESYILEINYSHLRCKQVLEIKNEKIVATKQNTCSGTPLQTVTDLLGRIESVDKEDKCGPNGCECDGKIGVKATYDAKYGYPRQINIGLNAGKSWFNIESLTKMFSVKTCTLIGLSEENITVELTNL